MKRTEILQAVHKAESQLSKAKIQRIQAAHDGASDMRIEELDAAVDAAREKCKVLRAMLWVTPT